MGTNKTLLKQLQAAKFSGMCEGLMMGLDLAAVASNHALGIGAKRLSEVSKEVQGILDEIQSIKDYDRLRADLVKELTRIYGEETRDFWLKRYISIASGV